MDNRKIDKVTTIISIILLLIVITIFKSCANRDEDHNDGRCDICGKKATYSSKGVEEYCDEHLEDAIEWYYKQMIEE